MFEDDSDRIYKVVLNEEEQYSLWPVERENPPGWHEDGFTGTKAECVGHVDQVWQDMRPLSLRRRMADDTTSA